MSGPGVAPSKGVLVCVGTRSPVKLGYTWKLWWKRTSFYLTPRSAGLGGWKISLHGPDPRHPGGPGFKLAQDGSPPPQDQVWMQATDGFLPCWFPGEPVREGAYRVVRLRWTADLFTTEAPPGPSTGNVGNGFEGRLLEPPPPGFATDVDLILAKYAPYYGENPREVFDQNAVIGPLMSQAGEYLTGIVVRRSLATTPTPANLITAPPPDSAEDAVRGIAAGLSQQGFIWACEALMSRRWMQGNPLST